MGGGRSYVHLPQGLTYDAWCDGVREGRSYVSDGFSHLMDFTVNGLEAGTRGSELKLERPGTVRASARVACLLPVVPVRAGVSGSPNLPVWSPEHARVAESRDVTVEVVVNGRPVATKRLTADGTLREMTFDVAIERSSWIALRILGSAHTNPIFIVVNNRPVRASRKSAQWCLQAVDQRWSQKSRRFNAAVREAAQAAYEHARARYRQILSESEVE